jgi:LPXTG-site transpeptidase (sortase) family protein
MLFRYHFHWMLRIGKKKLLRFLEKFFLISGLLVLGFYGSAKLYSHIYQKYTSYTFNEELSRRTPTIKGFVKSLFGIVPRIEKSEKSRPPTSPQPQIDEAELLHRMIYAPEMVPDGGKEWDKSRLDKYKKAQTPPAGSVLGRLEIPSLNLSVMLLQGTDDWTLNRAVGHIEGTSLPGQPGNLGIAGHRDGFFRCLKDIKRNSTVILTTLSGRFSYRVNGIDIVQPKDIEVLSTTKNPTLTLVTCYPFLYLGDAPKRYIVSAEMIKAESPNELAAEYGSPK